MQICSAIESPRGQRSSARRSGMGMGQFAVTDTIHHLPTMMETAIQATYTSSLIAEMDWFVHFPTRQWG